METLFELTEAGLYHSDSTTAILRPPTDIYDSPKHPTDASKLTTVVNVLLREFLATGILLYLRCMTILEDL